MITEKEIYDTPELKAMYDKITNYSHDIADLITATGVEKATLEYLSEHVLMFDDLIKKFIETNANTAWYKLYFDNSDNVSAKREIRAAYNEHIDPKYVKEYINTSSDELELEEKRSHYKEWSNEKENETSSASRETSKTSDDADAAVQTESAQSEKSNLDNSSCDENKDENEKNEEVELLNEEHKPYITAFIEQLLGVRHDFDKDEENNISDDTLFQDLIKLTTEAININKERNTTIINLRTALNAYKTYSANVEKQIEQLKDENEQLKTMYNNAVQQLDDYKAKNETISRKLNEVFNLQTLNNNLLEG